MPETAIIPALTDSLSIVAGTPLSGFFSLSAETLVSIMTTLGTGGAILWKIAKKDQQFESILDRVKEMEDGYLPRSEFRMYCESQQEAVKSLVSNFSSRMDLLDAHIQDVYRQHPSNLERKTL